MAAPQSPATPDHSLHSIASPNPHHTGPLLHIIAAPNPPPRRSKPSLDAVRAARAVAVPPIPHHGGAAAVPRQGKARGVVDTTCRYARGSRPSRRSKARMRRRRPRRQWSQASLFAGCSRWTGVTCFWKISGSSNQGAWSTPSTATPMAVVPRKQSSDSGRVVDATGLDVHGSRPRTVELVFVIMLDAVRREGRGTSQLTSGGVFFSCLVHRIWRRFHIRFVC